MNGIGNLGFKHLALVFAASVAAGFFIVLIDGFLIAPAEQAIFGVVSTTAPTITAA